MHLKFGDLKIAVVNPLYKKPVTWTLDHKPIESNPPVMSYQYYTIESRCWNLFTCPGLTKDSLIDFPCTMFTLLL